MTTIFPNKPIFIDTSAWIALIDPRDQYHERMIDYLTPYDGKVKGITSNLVLGELFTYFSRNNAIQQALGYLQGLLKDPWVRIIWVDRRLHEEASRIIVKFADQQLSFVDATSFAIMKKKKITSALTFDSDFSTAGFQMLP